MTSRFSGLSRPGHDPIDDGQSLLSLKSTLEYNKTKLIVIDPLHNATTGHSLQDGWDARRALNGLKRLCNRARVTALVLHYVKEHSSRGVPRPAESAQLRAASSMVWVLQSSPLLLQAGGGGQGGGGHKVQNEGRLVTLHSRGRGPFANRTWRFQSTNPLDYQPASPVEVVSFAPKQGNVVEEAIYKAMGRSMMTTNDIIEATKLIPNTARNAITRMYGRGDLTAAGVTSGARQYRVSRDSEWWKSNYGTEASSANVNQQKSEIQGEKTEESEESKESKESTD